jgi:hypothetical protein
MGVDLEIVVAHRGSRDFEEIVNLLPEATLTVYDKSGRYEGGTRIDDVGREGYVYLGHMVKKYETLAENTLFIQDDTKSHIPNQYEFLKKVLTISASGTPWFHQFPCTWRAGSQIYKRRVEKGICHFETLGEPDSIKRAAERLGIDLPEEYTTETCAFFIVKNKAIWRNSLDFYREALSWVLERDTHEFVLEHMWKIIFEKSNRRIP